MSDFHVTPRSDFDIDQSALALRKRFGLSLTDICPDVLGLLKKAAKLRETPLFGLNLEVRSKADLGDAEAYAICVPPAIVFREDVYAALANGHPRARMTAIHELMHIWLGHVGEPKHRMASGNGVVNFAKGAKSAEHQAKRGAASFLMPEGAVNQCSDYLEVQAKFGVSEHAAQIRYSQCALQRARQSPPEVLDFLRISSGRSPQTASGQASVRRERLETTVEACWRNAALIPGKDPSIVRCCCRGYEVLRSDYLKERSPKGWCIRDNRVVSYRALRLTGLGDKFASAFEDSPCPACGTFSVERRNGRRVCVECNKIQ